jgi:cell division protein FtsB
MQKENERSLAVIKELEEKNKLLAAEIRRLREDRQYLESVARKELGLVKDNEIIYRFKREWNGRGQGSENKNGKQQ